MKPRVFWSGRTWLVWCPWCKRHMRARSWNAAMREAAAINRAHNR